MIRTIIRGKLGETDQERDGRTCVTILAKCRNTHSNIVQVEHLVVRVRNHGRIISQFHVTLLQRAANN